MSVGYVLGSRIVNINSTGLPLRAVPHHQGSAGVTPASYWPPDVNSFVLVALYGSQIVKDLQVRILFQVLLCATKEGYLRV